MADTTQIDKLSLEIDYEATQANNGLKNLKETLSEMKSELSNSTTGLTKIANGLKNIATSTGALSTVNTDKFATNLKGITDAVGKLDSGNIGKGLTSVFKQLNNLPELNKKLDPITVKEFTEKIQTLSSALIPLANNLSSVGNVLSNLPSKLNKVSNYTQKTNQSVSLLQTMSKTLNFGAMIYGARRIGSALATFTDNSNKYVEDLNLFNVAMGESAGKAKEWIDTVSTALGLDPADMMRNMGVFNIMAKGFGLASDKAYIMSKNLTQLSYDIASFYNLSFEEAQSKLTSAFAGELEPVNKIAA